ncbi:MAG: inositol monophosphatase [Chloroflexi bacterium]|nr:inositol monophosphatase [Chloroflexota bacterium]
MPQPTPIELLTLAKAVALEAGGFVRSSAGQVRRQIETKSTATDMVTEVDRESEALIIGRILAARPGDGILGEEGGGRESQSGVRWIIDPLDGTTNFLYGFPAFSVSVAAELDGAVVAGAVYDAVHDECFWAARGGGAFLDATRIHVSTASDLARALIGTGFGYSAERRTSQVNVLAHVVPRVRDIRRGGSAALDHCWVACGRLDAYYERGVQLWDYAAGALIVEEAGGVTAQLAGGELDGARLAAPSALLAPLSELLFAAAAAASRA